MEEEPSDRRSIHKDQTRSALAEGERSRAEPGEDKDAPPVHPPASPPQHPSGRPETDTTANTRSGFQFPFQFGQRYLDPATDDVFAHNAWDHVHPDADHLAYCQEQYAFQRSRPVSEFDRKRFNADPVKWWDLFYKQKSTTFFKDRKWLKQEFPILAHLTNRDGGPKILLEVGAGAGNTAFPILRENENEHLRIWAVDYSAAAVTTMRNSSEYDGKIMRAEVWDLASNANEQNEQGGGKLPDGLSEQTVDVVVLIFVLSALSPDQWQQAVRNVWTLLKPGGQVLFRDYGRGDLAQVRFKAGRWMGENFYVRGDGTRVYFFDRDELERLWSGDGDWDSTTAAVQADVVSHLQPRFVVNDLAVDRRMIVNRQRKIKMHRCWIQGHFTKPSVPSQADRGHGGGGQTRSIPDQMEEAEA